MWRPEAKETKNRIHEKISNKQCVNVEKERQMNLRYA